MTYSELLSVVNAANQIGTIEVKKQARAYIYASEETGTISKEKRIELVKRLGYRVRAIK